MKKLPVTIQKGLSQEYLKYKPDIDRAVQRVLKSGRYILGKELEKFEKNFAKLVGAKYAVGVGNGFDALFISLKCLSIPHPRVYVWRPTRHISTYNAILAADGVVIPDSEQIDVVIPTIHPTHFNNIKIFFKDKIVIEDACQSIGMKRKMPKYVKAACYSFHPLKMLHCYGDGGAVATNDKKMYEKMKEFRNHGRIGITDKYRFGCGVNSRLDEIQAVILNVMMRKLKGKI